jgi:hypothetical protein
MQTRDPRDASRSPLCSRRCLPADEITRPPRTYRPRLLLFMRDRAQNSESLLREFGTLRTVPRLLESEPMTRAMIVVLLAGCAAHSTTTDNASIHGDVCAVYTTATSCESDSTCSWFGTGCACPPNDPSCVCSPGVCASIDGAGSNAGSGSSTAACACPDGGVCYEQIGGPAEPSNGPQVECTQPAPGTGDPCARITGQGACQDSTTVSGLCICDNGER